MIKNKNVIWGMKCTNCNSNVFVLQEEVHPWFATETVFIVRCKKCGKLNGVTQKEAECFYNNKIHALYDHVFGNILDLGCGGGFITNYLDSKDEVNNIYAIDNDNEARDFLNSSDKIYFIHGDVKEIDDLLTSIHIDYIVSRDMVMYVEDVQSFIHKISHIASKGIVIVGWYNPTLSRVKNKVHPEEIGELLVKQGFEIEYRELDWYKYGYVIFADNSE